MNSPATFFGLTVVVVVRTVHRTGRKRAFRAGFTLFGWTYLMP
jgi:hypothetical protein